jgi:hypothetical protein
MSTRKPIDFSAAFLFEVPEWNSPLVVQELQIGGTSHKLLSECQILNFIGVDYLTIVF